MITLLLGLTQGDNLSSTVSVFNGLKKLVNYLYHECLGLSYIFFEWASYLKLEKSKLKWIPQYHIFPLHE